MINRRYRAGLYRHVSASNVKLFSSFSGSLKHFGITTFYLCCHPWFNCSVERCFGGCGLLLFISEEFLRPIQGENLAWSTAVVLVFCWTNWGFWREEILAYCAVVFQSSGCLPPFAAVVAKRYKTMLWWGELHLNMSTYPQRNSSG